MVSNAARQQTAFAANVKQCPGSFTELAISALIMMALSGIPEARDLAEVMMSGMTP